MEKELVFITDIDDTMLDFMNPLLNVHNWCTNSNIKRADIIEYCLPQAIRETFIKYEADIYKALPILPKVKNTLKKVKSIGYRVILMTARDISFKHDTEFNLAINGLVKGIDFDEIYFNKNKSLKINRLSEVYNIQYFIDDRLDTINKVKKNTSVPYVYLINTYSNRNEDVEEGIIRINNIHEIKLDK